VRIAPFGATVLVDGWQLTGAVDRAAEARLQARMVPEDAREAWCYGAGLGDLPAALLERPALRRLHLCLLSAELERRLDPLRAVAHDPRLVVHAPGAVRHMGTPWTVVPGELRHVDPPAFPLRDEILASLNLPFNERVRDVMASRRALQRAENVRACPSDPHVSCAFGNGPLAAVVVGGGPTAGWNLRAVAKLQRKRAAVIAVSRVLAPLLAGGVIPDYVVHIDPFSGAATVFPEPDDRLAGTTLVYLREVEPATARDWPGPRRWMAEEDLFAGGSVVHAAADLATRLGALRVDLVGVDFCFPRGRLHAAGALGPSGTIADGPLLTLDGWGRRVATQEALMHYHRSMEVLIERRPGVEWVKHDRRGVALQGARWASWWR